MNAQEFTRLLALFMVFHGTMSVNIPDFLLECYSSESVVNNENKLPKNMFTLIEIIRKMEMNEHFSMSLTSFSSSLIRRFRKDGIVSSMVKGGDVVPYYVHDYTSEKLNIINKLVPGNIERFPNESISHVERCSLHSMISMNVNKLYRGDESETCRFTRGAFHRRYLRETRFSECPTEDGAVLTESGTVNAGSVLAGIAAGGEKQSVSLRYLLKTHFQKDIERPLLSVDNRWFSTVSGDLAEVALRQGPSKRFVIGVKGDWNTTVIPKWYFINTGNQLPIFYELTAAELKGGMDGLILSQYIRQWSARSDDLRLSQVLDMYYSSRGIFNHEYNSCNRHKLFTSIVNDDKLRNEVIAASRILYQLNVAIASFDDYTLQEYSDNAVTEYRNLITESNDLSTAECKPENDNPQIYHHASTDLTIFLDTNWDFSIVQKLLVKILEGIEVGQYNSNFTILNAKDGSVIVNSTNSILDFYASFNLSSYERLPRGLDLARIFYTLDKLQPMKLKMEKERGLGGQKSDIVLIMPHSDSVDSGEDYYYQQMERIAREVPDCHILFYVKGIKEKWVRYVTNRETDLFSFNIGQVNSATKDLVSRIKQIPKRLINSQCGSNYVQSGSTYSFDDYIEPYGINFYRMHPNYFFTYDQYNIPKIKVRGFGMGTLEICESREILNIDTINRIKSYGANCKNITNNIFEVSLMHCYDKYLIKDCPPVYISVKAVSASSNLQCSDKRYCRYPDMLKYSISYENLVCRSGAVIAYLTPLMIMIISMSYLL